MNKTEILKRVNIALDLFYENDAKLIEIEAQERAISHRFSVYIESLFRGYNIDCEYDKHGDDHKRLEGIQECRTTDNPTNRILPDIIVHKRGVDTDNLIVFEIKSKTEATPCDIKKLELMTQEGEDLFEYEFGIFIKFNKTRANTNPVLYVKGTLDN